MALLGTVACILCPAQDISVIHTSPRKPNGPTGIVTGTVYCADTNAPARLAQIYLTSTSGDKSNSSALTNYLK